MNDIFFIADTHFGHKNVLEYEPIHRPFKTIEEHDEELIRRWNSVVKPTDTIYHLGDFCLGGQKNVELIASRLNGKKILILGNHDCYPIALYMKYFHRVFGVLPFKGNFILSHVPLHPNHTRWEINIHGHLHSNVVTRDNPKSWYGFQISDERYYNVSCEQINLTPINFEIIREETKYMLENQ